MTGGGPFAATRHTFKTARIGKNNAVFRNHLHHKRVLMSNSTRRQVANFVPLCLKVVRQLYTECSAILLDTVLYMEIGGGIIVGPVQQIVNAGGEFQVFDNSLAEQRQV